MEIEQGERILFIGDSVTDAGRDKAEPTDLGPGYPRMITTYLQANYPDYHVQTWNRGVSGDQIHQLEKRWQEDCLDLKPTLVSILIGINDTWHYEKSANFGSTERTKEFEVSYRNLLDQLTNQHINKIMLMEPYVLPYPESRKAWRVDLDPKIEIVRKLAKEYKTELISLDEILNQLGKKNGCQLYTGEDGVHPTAVVHYEISKAWLKKLLKQD